MQYPTHKFGQNEWNRTSIKWKTLWSYRLKTMKQEDVLRIYVVRQDIFAWIVWRIFTKTCWSLNILLNLLVLGIIQTHNPNVWIVNSRASSHMTQRKELWGVWQATIGKHGGWPHGRGMWERRHSIHNATW